MFYDTLQGCGHAAAEQLMISLNTMKYNDVCVISNARLAEAGSTAGVAA